MEQEKGRIDWLIFLSAATLILMSCVFIYSASVGFAMKMDNTTDAVFTRHLSFAVAGIFFMILFSQINYQIWQKLSKIAMILTIALLITALFTNFGVSSHGAHRWLKLGGITFQPSELAKIALVMHIAALLVRYQDRMDDFKEGFLPFLFWIGLVSVLIALQPNFSTMMVLFGISMLLLYIGNANWKHLLSTITVGLLLGLVYGLSADYRWQRIMSFFGKEEGVNENVSHQITQSLIAIGNGGFWGVGPGQSRQSHRFLPEAHSDFIFSIIGEEYGFVGIFIILLAFAVILFRGFKAVKSSKDEYGYYLGAGILIIFGMYLLINVSVCVGLLPTTGLPLPFISYGGTAIVINSCILGILLNITAQSNLYPFKNKKEDLVSKDREDEIVSEAYLKNLERQEIKLIIKDDKKNEQAD